jgi:polyisoprenoid-binding protein YceI
MYIYQVANLHFIAAEEKPMTWNIDPSHSSVEFAVKHMVIASTKGRFADYDVEAEIDEANLANSSATVRINAASIDTRDAKRDAHLRSADFFDAETYPAITFTSKRLEAKGGSDYRIIGDLTIRGVTGGCPCRGSGGPTDPWGGTRLGLERHGKAAARVRASWNAPLEAGGLLVGETSLTIETELMQLARRHPLNEAPATGGPRRPAAASGGCDAVTAGDFRKSGTPRFATAVGVGYRQRYEVRRTHAAGARGHC